MAKRDHTELITGLFVLGALAAGVGVLVWLGTIQLGRGQQAVFAAAIGEGDTGLEVGSAVKVNDAVVGRLIEIRYQPADGRTLYLARLDRNDVSVRADASASAVGDVLGGGSIVLEHLGSPAAPPADRATPARLAASHALLKSMGYGAEQKEQFRLAMAKVSSSAENLDHLMAALGGNDAAEVGAIVANVRKASNALGASAANLATITAAVKTELDKNAPDSLLAGVKRSAGHVESGSANAQAVTESLRYQTDRAKEDSILAKALRGADQVERAAADAAGMIAKVRPDVERTAAELRQLAQKDLADLLVKFRTAGTNLVTVSEDLRAVSGTTREMIVLNRERMDDTLANIASMSANLDAAAKEIRRNPWRLLHRPDEKELQRNNVYDTARAFVEGARELNDAAARLRALRDDRPEGVRTDDPELAKIRDHLKASFEKFRSVEDALWKELAK